MVREGVDKIWTENDINHIDEKYTPPAAKVFKARVAAEKAAFPDLKMIVDNVIVDGSDIVVRWTKTGTHKETGAQATWSGMTYIEADGFTALGQQPYWDTVAQHKQLGYTLIAAKELQALRADLAKAKQPAEESATADTQP
jgi:hypothetical protein